MPDKERIRQELISRAMGLLRRHGVLDDHLHNRDREVPRDMEEQGEFLENDLLYGSLEGVLRQQIEGIAAALRRIDSGTWEHCDRCGAEIAEARIEALPTTALCQDCAHEVEAVRP